MRIIRYFLIIMVLLVALTFALLNANSVAINYYLGSSKLPLSLLLVITFVIGCVLGCLTTISWYWRARFENRKLSKKLGLAEKELTNLRAMPWQETKNP